MSSVPPNLVGPILQSNLTQRQVSQVRDNAQVQEATARRQTAAVASEKSNAVETDDNDTAVHADAEGAGSQGRAFTSPEDEEQPSNVEPADHENDADDEGRHIDFEA